jgi:23S rRNA (uracil1939-C5)-methyltransferase
MERKEFVVTPEAWLSRGEASVAGDGVQLSVFGGIPGERARVRVVSERPHQVRSRWIGPAGPRHPDRVQAPCERWGSCGRCSLMHLRPEGARNARRTIWSEAFHGAPCTLDEAGAPLAGSDVLHAVTLLAGRSDIGRARLGVEGLNGIVAIPDCPVVVPTLRKLMGTAAHAMIAQRLRPVGMAGGTFLGLVARAALTSEDVVATLAFTRAVPFARAYAEGLLAEVPQLAGVVAHWCETKPARGLIGPGAEVSVLEGRPWLEETVSDAAGPLKVRVGAADPWHATQGALAAHLAAVEALGAGPGDTPVDLGCGVGLRTLLLARRAGWALGVDQEAHGLARARQSAAPDGNRAMFLGLEEGDSAVSHPEVVARVEGRRPHVLLDTGTRGLDPATRALLQRWNPRRVVLIGTNPRALANDASTALGTGGLSLTRISLHDADPHTPHGVGLVVLDSTDTTAATRRAPRRTLVR